MHGSYHHASRCSLFLSCTCILLEYSYSCDIIVCCRIAETHPAKVLDFDVVLQLSCTVVSQPETNNRHRKICPRRFCCMALYILHTPPPLSARPLFVCVIKHQTQEFLYAGGDPNMRDSTYLSPLHNAAIGGSPVRPMVVNGDL